MNTPAASILVVNGGSSSIKFAFYNNSIRPVLLLHGKINRIGLKDSSLSFTDRTSNRQENIPVTVFKHPQVIKFFIGWLEKQQLFSSVTAIGHRLVHGMEHTEPELITDALIHELQNITSYDPDHLPDELDLIETFHKRYKHLPQVACFDTSFHTDMPKVAKLLPIPRRISQQGIHRYGFHGLSYAYLLLELKRIGGSHSAQGRVIMLHLGSGSSLAAIHKGKSIDTSMGFTPAGGMMMGSRPGDLDPGVAWYIMQSEKLTPKKFNQFINHECGLLGVSETSTDMKDLLSSEGKDMRAAEAIELFCYQARKWIGSFAAALGGVDTLVFSGGIGESSPVIRSRICKGLDFLGVKLDNHSNNTNASIISTDRSPAVVRVISTNEEWMIAKNVKQLINRTKNKKGNHESKQKSRKGYDK